MEAERDNLALEVATARHQTAGAHFGTPDWWSASVGTESAVERSAAASGRRSAAVGCCSAADTVHTEAGTGRLLAAVAAAAVGRRAPREREP